jgi:tetratricopeptide (TPR) repeat protein
MNSDSPRSGCATWAGRAALLVIGPVLLFAAFETACRFFDLGYPTSFLVPDEVDDTAIVRANEFYGYRFFEPLMARSPAPIQLERGKPEGVTRVAVLGESAAMGDPLIEFGLARALDKILNAPGEPRRFEVLNAAMTAISSPVVVDIAEDLARAGVDVFVVLMGNNEVVGPYGPGTAFRQGATADFLVPWHVRWTRSRTASALQGLRSLVAPGKSWDGMALFAENRIASGGDLLRGVHERHARNLRRLTAIAEKNQIGLVLCTVPVNLRDCPPFGSASAAAGETEQRARESAFASGSEALHAGDPASARSFFAEALRLDPGYAETNFFAALAAEKSGDDAQAARLYGLARDLDTLRVRTDSRMNDAIRATARRHGAALVDGDEVFGLAPGEADFVDHVHFTLEGVAKLANAVAAAILASEGAPFQPVAPRVLAERMGWDDWSESKLAAVMVQRLRHPPFRDQSGNAERLARWESRHKAAGVSLAASGTTQTLERLAALEAAYPGDPDYAVQALHRLAGQGEWGRAAELADRIRPALRGTSATVGLLALVYAKAGRARDAAAVLVETGPPYGYFLTDAAFQLLSTLDAMGDADTARSVREALLRDAAWFPGRPALEKWRARSSGPGR